jgi:gas vesicle protein
MKNQSDVQSTTTQSSCQGSTFACLVAGLGIGAAVSMLLAPKSGTETRQWIANKCFNGIDTANEKVRQTRLHVKDVMDRGQQKISEAVVAGREAIGKSKAAES